MRRIPWTITANFLQDARACETGIDRFERDAQFFYGHYTDASGYVHVPLTPENIRYASCHNHPIVDLAVFTFPRWLWTLFILIHAAHLILHPHMRLPYDLGKSLARAIYIPWILRGRRIQRKHRLANEHKRTHETFHVPNITDSL